MKNEEMVKKVAAAIDHAVLKPTDTEADVIKACEIAEKFNVASVCVKPCHVALAAELLKDSKVAVCTVIGFPHGANTIFVKSAEAQQAIENGAVEIDMVLNISKALEGNLKYLKNEIETVARCVHENNAILKVIVETAYLNEEQKRLVCKAIELGGADFFKTSTGFAPAGAVMEDIKLAKEILPDNIRLKASGGIRNFEQAAAFIEAGCERLGVSATEAILAGEENRENY